MNDFSNQLIDGTDLSAAIEETRTADIGQYFQNTLTDALADGDEPEGFAFGLTRNRAMLVSMNYETHDQRLDICRVAGRFFSNTAVDADEELLYIGTCSTGLSSSRPDVKPSEDKYHTEVAMTTIQSLVDCYQATDVTSLAAAINSGDYLFYLDNISEGFLIDTTYKAAQVVGKDEYDALSEEEQEGKTTVINHLLNEIFIGSTYAFPVARQLSEATA